MSTLRVNSYVRKNIWAQQLPLWMLLLFLHCIKGLSSLFSLTGKPLYTQHAKVFCFIAEACNWHAQRGTYAIQKKTEFLSLSILSGQKPIILTQGLPVKQEKYSELINWQALGNSCDKVRLTHNRNMLQKFLWHFFSYQAKNIKRKNTLLPTINATICLKSAYNKRYMLACQS